MPAFEVQVVATIRVSTRIEVTAFQASEARVVAQSIAQEKGRELLWSVPTQGSDQLVLLDMDDVFEIDTDEVRGVEE